MTRPGATRLAIISPSGEDSGAERYLRIIAAAARKRGWSVHVGLPEIDALRRLRADLDAIGAESSGLHLGAAHSPGKLRALEALLKDWWIARRWLRRAQPDRILLVLPHPEQTPGAVLAAAFDRARSVASIQLTPDDLAITWQRRTVYRLAQRLGQTWLTLSQDNRRRLAGALGCRVERLEMVYNAAWTDEPPPEVERPRLRAELRRELGLDPEARLILSVGRLNQQKGYDLTAQAVPLIGTRYGDVRFVWAGEGGERRRLEATLRGSGALDRVLMLGNRDDVARLLAGADLFLFPSRYEGFPLALLEAVSAGLPVIANAAGPLPEVVRDRIDGLVVDCTDPARLAEAVAWALEHPGEMAELARTARARVRTEFSRANMTERTLGLISRAAARPAAG